MSWHAGHFSGPRSLTALSWLRRADQCKDDKPDPGDLDQRQRLTEHNDAKTGRYYRIAKGKKRRAHRSDHRYGNEKGNHCESIQSCSG